MKNTTVQISSDDCQFEGIAERRGENILIISVRNLSEYRDHDMYCDLKNLKSCRSFYCDTGETVSARGHDLIIEDECIELTWYEGQDTWLIEGELPSMQELYEGI